MGDLIDQIVSEVRGSWRFRWLAIGVAWIVCLIGWTVVYLLPDSYESQATVLFETTSDLSELLESMTVNSDFLGQVETVQTALLGREQLENVVRETDLRYRAETPAQMASLIAEVRGRIEITSGQQRGANIYEIGYRDTQPEVAYEVVSKLLNSLVDRSLGVNREDTQQAKAFLRAQLDELETQLTESERRLAEFKRENVGMMPGEGGGYFTRLNGEMVALDETRNAIRQAERRRDTLRLQLAGDQQASIGNAGEPSPLDLRITEHQKQLEALQLRFTEKHPDVVSLSDTLEQLREQKRRQLEALRSSDMTAAASSNPVLQNIQIELAKVNVELASLEEQAQTQQRKISELRSHIDVLPKIEADLARLNRDYDVNQAQYNALLQRLEVAELSESAKQSSNNRIQVINPPQVPTTPAAPDRPLYVAAVLLLGFMAGGGLAFLRNQMKPVFTAPRELREKTGLPILGMVQVLSTRDVRHRRLAQVGAFGFALLALGATFVMAILFEDAGSEYLRLLTKGI